MDPESKRQFSNTALQWLDVPYRHRGLTRRGCDCTGLLIGVLQELGHLKDYRLRYYPKDWNLHAFADNFIMEEVEKVAHRVPFGSCGDIVLFHFGKCIAHAGIVLDNDLFIHSHVKAGKCTISKLRHSPWASRIAGYYALDLEAVQ